MTTDPTTSPVPQDVREALAGLIFAAEQYLDFDGDRRAIPDLIRRAKEKGKAALAQPDAGADASGLIEAAELARVIYEAVPCRYVVAYPDTDKPVPWRSVIDFRASDKEAAFKRADAVINFLRSRAADRSGK